jgi:hypothetical protein
MNLKDFQKRLEDGISYENIPIILSQIINDLDKYLKYIKDEHRYQILFSYLKPRLSYLSKNSSFTFNEFITIINKS